MSISTGFQAISQAARPDTPSSLRLPNRKTYQANTRATAMTPMMVRPTMPVIRQ
jgi:hypothetical protein